MQIFKKTGSLEVIKIQIVNIKVFKTCSGIKLASEPQIA